MIILSIYPSQLFALKQYNFPIGINKAFYHLNQPGYVCSLYVLISLCMLCGEFSSAIVTVHNNRFLDPTLVGELVDFGQTPGDCTVCAIKAYSGDFLH